MTPLGLSVATWWWIAVLMTVLFWTLLVPPMRTREHRIQAVLTPLVMGLFLLAGYKVKGMPPADALMMYSVGVLTIPLGLVGHLRKLVRRMAEAEREGRSMDQGVLTMGALAQLFGAIVVTMTAYFLLKV